MTRRSVEIASLKHAGPVPCATQIGPLIESSIIPPFNAGSRDVPETVEAQVDNLFIHVGNMLTETGASWDDVAKMTFFVKDPTEARSAITRSWEEAFPDPASRPARHDLQVQRDGPAKVTCEFTAYLGGST